MNEHQSRQADRTSRPRFNTPLPVGLPDHFLIECAPQRFVANGRGELFHRWRSLTQEQQRGCRLWRAHHGGWIKVEPSELDLFAAPPQFALLRRRRPH